MQTTFMWQAFHMKLDFSNEDSRAAAMQRAFNVMFNVLICHCLITVSVFSSADISYQMCQRRLCGIVCVCRQTQ